MLHLQCSLAIIGRGSAEMLAIDIRFLTSWASHRKRTRIYYIKLYLICSWLLILVTRGWQNLFNAPSATSHPQQLKCHLLFQPQNYRNRSSKCGMSRNVLQKFTPKTQSSVQVQDVTGRAAGVSSTVQLETDVQQQFYSNTVLRTCWNHSNLWLCAN